MARRHTIVDIAGAAGVSKSTVSLVLTGAARVRPETERAVRDAMDRLGYVYNRAAAQLRNPTSRIVGMVINDLANPFFAELAIGIEHALRVSGTVPFLANTQESARRQAELIRSMREHGASGIILCPSADTDAAEINRLTAVGLPLVLAIRRIDGARISTVASDNRGGALAATSHLLNLGHRRIAFLGGHPGLPVREERLAGYFDALAAAGIDPDPALISTAPPTREGGFNATCVLLAGPHPTAIAAYNDVTAIGAMFAITRSGLVPGRDIAVTGFDDTSEARLCTPPLTTVAVGAADLGERAAAILLRRIAGGAEEAFIGGTKLMIRQSCGAVKEKALLF